MFAGGEYGDLTPLPLTTVEREEFLILDNGFSWRLQELTTEITEEHRDYSDWAIRFDLRFSILKIQ